MSPAAAAQAETCARRLAPQLNLLVQAPDRPNEQALRTLLTGEGLTGITIGPELGFTAATGEACLHGDLSAAGPDLSIGPPGPDGTCHL